MSGSYTSMTANMLIGRVMNSIVHALGHYKILILFYLEGESTFSFTNTTSISFIT